MDKDFIAFFAIGIVAIGMAVFGKFRPEVIYRNYKGVIAPDKQRFMSILLVIYGIMFILVGVVACIPQFQAVRSALAFTIVMIATVVMLFFLWKILLSQNESLRGIGLAAIMLVSLAIFGITVYYWHLTLN